jgi:hypothetical protein
MKRTLLFLLSLFLLVSCIKENKQEFLTKEKWILSLQSRTSSNGDFKNIYKIEESPKSITFFLNGDFKSRSNGKIVSGSWVLNESDEKDILTISSSVENAVYTVTSLTEDEMHLTQIDVSEGYQIDIAFFNHKDDQVWEVNRKLK